MVSSSHEAMHRIFQDYPGLFSGVSKALGVGFPPPTAITVLPNDVTETRPVERRIDTLLRLDTEHHGPFLLAVEAQGKKDPEKPVSWAYYISHLRSKYGLEPLLLVVCQDRATAEWAARPKPIGFHWPSLRVLPLVAGPHNMPVISDPAEVRKDLALATLSTITHGKGPDIETILNTMTAALLDSPETVRAPIIEFISQGLGKLPAAAIWRKLVAVDLSFYKSPISEELRDEGRVEGQVEGVARSILLLLAQNGVDVPDEARARITGCGDLDTLSRWLLRTPAATSVEEIFAED